MTRRVTITGPAITRAIKAAGAAGFDVAAVEITADGTIRLIGDNGTQIQSVNPWDEVLTNGAQKRAS